MKLVFKQQYTNNIQISSYYGKPLKGLFKGDVIRLDVGVGDSLYMTPDEASTIIRALSTALSFYLVENDKFAKLKK